MASEQTEQHTKKPTLPTIVVTPTDIGRLIRELETIQNNLLQLTVRDPGSHVAMPSISMRMQRLAELNQWNLLQKEDRQVMQGFLQGLKDKPMAMHISFSGDPSPSFLEKLIVWLRREINPLVLVTVGLQPTIGAGCVVRTTNKYFDLSLRQTLIAKRPLLLEQIIPAVAAERAPVTQEATAA